MSVRKGFCAEKAFNCVKSRSGKRFFRPTFWCVMFFSAVCVQVFPGQFFLCKAYLCKTSENHVKNYSVLKGFSVEMVLCENAPAFVQPLSLFLSAKTSLCKASLCRNFCVQQKYVRKNLCGERHLCAKASLCTNQPKRKKQHMKQKNASSNSLL